MLKISIITVCYNSEKFLEGAIQSVLSQTYKNIEYIVVDGNSVDGTKSIIENYRDKISIYISEPDNGIYDAMNKGIKLATGDIVGFLNSDDFYSSKDSISKAINVFNENNVDCVYANINYVNAINSEKIVRFWVSGRYIKNSFSKGWHPAHPTFWVKRKIYEKYGGFNLRFKLAADFELMLRFLEKYRISNFYLNLPLIHMRLGGATSGSFKNVLKQNVECFNAFKTNQIKVSYFYPLYRILPKIKQFYKS